MRRSRGSGRSESASRSMSCQVTPEGSHNSCLHTSGSRSILLGVIKQTFCSSQNDQMSSGKCACDCNNKAVAHERDLNLREFMDNMVYCFLHSFLQNKLN